MVSPAVGRARLRGSPPQSREIRISPPRAAGSPRLHSRLGRFRDVRETTGEAALSLPFAVAERYCVASVPTSALDTLGDTVSLVTARPLEPVVRMPDTALAGRVAPPPELHAIVASARELATVLYAHQYDDARPRARDRWMRALATSVPRPRACSAVGPTAATSGSQKTTRGTAR